MRDHLTLKKCYRKKHIFSLYLTLLRFKLDESE
jgi:hypothetical protein